MTDEALSWDDIFAPIDKAVENMTPVARACSSCSYAEIPPMPDDPEEGWLASCVAPMPVNTMLHPSKVQLTFAAADAARWESKRQKSCPAWKSRNSD